MTKSTRSSSAATSAAATADVSSPSTLATPALSSQSLRMSYTIGRGETGVLTFEPYKSALLPHWRFKTPAIAHSSSTTLFALFLAYGDKGDFVGMDMARKFIQMGMTRAKRYANHKGGRKYVQGTNVEGGDKRDRVELPRSEGHDGREDKERASAIFREVWERCKADATYQRLKEGFVAEQKAWKKERKREEG